MDLEEELSKELLKEQIKIDIEDGGIVTIASHDGAAAEEAQKIIEGLTRKVHEGEIFSGVVTRIIPIGAFVEILPGKEGMVHISQLSEARVERVEDVVRQGDEVTVRVRIDSRGRINLTLRGVGQNNECIQNQLLLQLLRLIKTKEDKFHTLIIFLILRQILPWVFLLFVWL